MGYGVSKKSHLTGSVGSVKMDEDVVGRPAVEVGQSLYGKVAGVQVIGGSGDQVVHLQYRLEVLILFLQVVLLS